MSSLSPALKKDTVKTRPAPEKVRALAAKTPFQAPKVIAFPLDGMTTQGPLTMAGNI